MSKIAESTIQTANGRSITLVELQNDKIKVGLLPEIGGKIISIESKKTGTNYLLTPKKKYHFPNFGDAFDLRYAYGFDECFPTIQPCNYKTASRTIALPDHGEVWSRPWEHVKGNHSIALSVFGINLNYVLRKILKLTGRSLLIEYMLENKSSQDFDYIWSSHPLLSVNPGDEIILNEEVKELLVNWCSDPDMGVFGEQIRWPQERWNQEKIDWSTTQSKKANIAIKLFTDELRQGQAAIYKKNIDESLLFRFNTDTVPYLGLWLCYGGWPEKNDKRSYAIALEPASARPDALTKALERNRASKIKARATRQWSLEIRLENGRLSV